MDNVFDTIILGAGPAGMSAAIYAARREMKALVISENIGGQIIWASEIENYPGFKSIKSYELIQKMREQVEENKIEIINSHIIRTEKENNIFKIETADSKYFAKTLIVTIGLAPRTLDVPGEKEFNGRGVAYCANCDGPFYKNKTIAVIGGGNAALDAAEVMSKIANQIYLIHHHEKFQGFEILVDKVKSAPNIKIYNQYTVFQINGNKKVNGVEINNCLTNEKVYLDIDGIFIEIGRKADTSLVKDLVKRDENDQIIIDEKCATSMPGVFAAGDVTTIPFKQIVIATGQGAIAALSAYQYLQFQND